MTLVYTIEMPTDVTFHGHSRRVRLQAGVYVHEPVTERRRRGEHRRRVGSEQPW